ncbi:MAG: hypothetical protein ACI92I_000848 [Acidimicrobiales bacterium]|jgi:hypothetical protein
MNSISIEGKKYVKATYIARELGYTADYVGQLCRAGKIDAQQVGRNWYVSEDSIRSHKKTRYRSTKAVSQREIKEIIHTKDADSQESFSVSITKGSTKNEVDQTHYAEQQFYSRAPKKVNTAYFSDDNELIPKGVEVKNKSGSLSVQLADAQDIPVQSSSVEAAFTPTERPALRFTGSVAVSEVEDEPEKETIKEVSVQLESETEGVIEELKEIEKTATAVITNNVKVIHRRKDKKKKHKDLPLEYNVDGVIGMKRDDTVARNPVDQTLKVSVSGTNPSVESAGSLMILLTSAISLVLAVCILGLESHVYVEAGGVYRSYVFEIDSILATVLLAL